MLRSVSHHCICLVFGCRCCELHVLVESHPRFSCMGDLFISTSVYWKKCTRCVDPSDTSRIPHGNLVNESRESTYHEAICRCRDQRQHLVVTLASWLWLPSSTNWCTAPNPLRVILPGECRSVCACEVRWRVGPI